jgi:3',5'-nucleoside bisphosphate phosphatase
VARAAGAGVRLLALTDHDTVDGVPEALQAARRAGLRLVPAVEVSAVDGRHQDLHVLGYGIRPGDPDLREALRRSRADRERRAWAMAGRLRDLGYALDESSLQERAAAGDPIGRPHLARAAVTHPDNAERLAAEGLAELTSFLVAHLIEGKPAFVGRTTPTVTEAIAMIHAAGGHAVWAHPFWDVEDPDEVLATLDRLVAQGLDGVEAFYVTHTAEQVRLLAGHATAHDLLATGSSDFHGPGHRMFSAFCRHDLHGLRPRLGPIDPDEVA